MKKQDIINAVQEAVQAGMFETEKSVMEWLDDDKLKYNAKQLTSIAERLTSSSSVASKVAKILHPKVKLSAPAAIAMIESLASEVSKQYIKDSKVLIKKIKAEGKKADK